MLREVPSIGEDLSVHAEITYLRDMYELYTEQRAAAQELYGDEAEQTRAAQNDRDKLIDALANPMPEVAGQIIDVFSEGGVASRGLSALLAGKYAICNRIDSDHAVETWMRLRRGNDPYVNARVAKSASHYVSFLMQRHASDELAVRRAKRLAERLQTSAPAPLGAS